MGYGIYVGFRANSDCTKICWSYPILTVPKYIDHTQFRLYQNTLIFWLYQNTLIIPNSDCTKIRWSYPILTVPKYVDHTQFWLNQNTLIIPNSDCTKIHWSYTILTVPKYIDHTQFWLYQNTLIIRGISIKRLEIKRYDTTDINHSCNSYQATTQEWNIPLALRYASLDVAEWCVMNWKLGDRKWSWHILKHYSFICPNEGKSIKHGIKIVDAKAGGIR
jgi:hypothetical protein